MSKCSKKSPDFFFFGSPDPNHERILSDVGSLEVFFFPRIGDFFCRRFSSKQLKKSFFFFFRVFFGSVFFVLTHVFFSIFLFGSETTLFEKEENSGEICLQIEEMI